MYATPEYYQTEYEGIQVEDTLLRRLLKRASRDIDSLTGFLLPAGRFETLPAWQQKLVKDAVCAQAEFLAERGETASLASSGGSVSIGSFSMSNSGKNGAQASDESLFASNVLDLLFPTGLLYRGGVRRG